MTDWELVEIAPYGQVGLIERILDLSWNFKMARRHSVPRPMRTCLRLFRSGGILARSPMPSFVILDGFGLRADLTARPE